MTTTEEITKCKHWDNGLDPYRGCAYCEMRIRNAARRQVEHYDHYRGIYCPPEDDE